MGILKIFAPDATAAKLKADVIRFESDEVFKALESLSQFIAFSDGGQVGLLNILTGCFVSNRDEGICLTWNGGNRLPYQHPLAHSFVLRDFAALQRFLAAMIAQARELA